MGIVCYICGKEIDENKLLLHAKRRHPKFVKCFEHWLTGKQFCTIDPIGIQPEENLAFSDAPFDEVVQNKKKRLGYKMFTAAITEHLSLPDPIKPIQNDILPVNYFGDYPESLVVIRKIDPHDLPFTLSARFLCQHCSAYGKKRCCPPIVKTVSFYREHVKRYKNCYIFVWQSDGWAGWHTHPDGMDPNKWGKVLIGVDAALRAFSYNVMSDIASMCKEHRVGVFVSLSGSCKKCVKQGCALPPLPCRHPIPGMASPEAMGVDVMSLLYSLGIPVQLPVFDFVTRVSIVYSKEEIGVW